MEIQSQLEGIADAPDFLEECDPLTEQWADNGVGIESVEPILRFMEAHSDLDLGTPGALVHFVERFYRRGYEELLIASLRRRPTAHTVWMLNRLLNGAKSSKERKLLSEELEAASIHPLADPDAHAEARGFLDRL